MSAPLNSLLDDLIASDAPEGFVPEADAVLEALTAWAQGTGRPLYPHQEEALFSLVAGDHVILSTPTGSGKSLVAYGALFNSLATGRTGYYTAPLKALVSEKFFELIGLFGAANVGMVTGDSSINAGAPIICATAEILANLALREGAGADVGMVVMDEFHYYGDPQRGWAWQVPLLELPDAQHLLMSGTLGDVDFFVRDLQRRTGRDVVVVDDAQRPVPLEWSYGMTPITELLEELAHTHRWPVYVVHFAQKDAVSQAQALLGHALVDRAQRERIAKALGDFRFGPGFGSVLSKLLRSGIGVHHAGMLPRYRRLVEQLAQAGLLAVICGTDTLGVGINVPIRTVVVTALTKFDGVKSRHLSARELHQIAGRAGRAGFDTVGYVIVQAPEHVIANAKALEKAGDDERKRKRITRKKAPEGVVNWTDKTFEKLRDSSPEPLRSQMRINHSMLLALMKRPGDPVAAAWKLITDNHEPDKPRNPLLWRAIDIYRSLKRSGVIEHLPKRGADGSYLRLRREIPEGFALNAPLAPFALAALDLLDLGSPDYPLDVISVIEAVGEDPRPVLYAQQRAARGEAVAAMKATGVEYEERMSALEEVTWPTPLADLLRPALATYVQTNPWAFEDDLSCKSVVREMIENAMTFTDLISRYDLARSEGVVLRYLTDTYRALTQILPPEITDGPVGEMIEWLGRTVRSVDSSLLDEWAALESGAGPGVTFQVEGQGATEVAFGADEDGNVRFSANLYRAKTAVRNAMFRLVEAAAADDPQRLEKLGRTLPYEAWDNALADYWDEYDDVGIGPSARANANTTINTRVDSAAKQEATDTAIASGVNASLLAEVPLERLWLVSQRLEDPEGDNAWQIRAWVSLDECDELGHGAVNAYSMAPVEGAV